MTPLKTPTYEYEVEYKATASGRVIHGKLKLYAKTELEIYRQISRRYKDAVIMKVKKV